MSRTAPRRYWLTGASSGIGAALAEDILKSGAHLAVSSRQTAPLKVLSQRYPGQVLVVAGDFNDWGARMRYAMNAMGLRDSVDLRGQRTLTYPSRLPVAQLDFIYGRRLAPLACAVPRGPIWARMSDHLPLVTDFSLSKQ